MAEIRWAYLAFILILSLRECPAHRVLLTGPGLPTVDPANEDPPTPPPSPSQIPAYKVPKRLPHLWSSNIEPGQEGINPLGGSGEGGGWGSGGDKNGGGGRGGGGGGEGGEGGPGFGVPFIPSIPGYGGGVPNIPGVPGYGGGGQCVPGYGVPIIPGLPGYGVPIFPGIPGYGGGSGFGGGGFGSRGGGGVGGGPDYGFPPGSWFPPGRFGFPPIGVPYHWLHHPGANHGNNDPDGGHAHEINDRNSPEPDFSNWPRSGVNGEGSIAPESG